MISIADVRTSIVSRLKAYAALTALVNDDIREESWMGRDYDYPNVRVYVIRLEPEGVSQNCAVYNCDFSVAYRAAGTSSKACADGMKIACEALIGEKLADAAFTAVTSVIFGSVPGPIPESEDAWMARATFSCKVKEV